MLSAAFEEIRTLLDWLPVDVRTVVALPILILALFALALVALRLGAGFLGGAGDPVARGAVSTVGLLLLVPEFLITRGIRRLRLRPPALSHLYGEAVVQVTALGQRAAAAWLTGLAQRGSLRRRTALVIVAALLLVGNDPPDDTSCANVAGRTTNRAAGSGCEAPLSHWWSTVVDIARADDPPSKPRPTRRPARTPTKNSAR